MKIYFGGDSFLYGYGLKREDALPYLFSKYINSDFLVLYGDTISDIDINELIHCHQSKNKPITMTVWPLQIQFGLANIDKEGKVLSFQEKPILDKWINIGYFYIKYDVFEVINEYNKFDKFLENQNQNHMNIIYDNSLFNKLDC